MYYPHWCLLLLIFDLISSCIRALCRLPFDGFNILLFEYFVKQIVLGVNFTHCKLGTQLVHESCDFGMLLEHSPDIRFCGSFVRDTNTCLPHHRRNVPNSAVPLLDGVDDDRVALGSGLSALVKPSFFSNIRPANKPDFSPLR